MRGAGHAAEPLVHDLPHVVADEHPREQVDRLAQPLGLATLARDNGAPAEAHDVGRPVRRESAMPGAQLARHVREPGAQLVDGGRIELDVPQHAPDAARGPVEDA